MGEVRVPVRLENYFDRLLVRKGRLPLSELRAYEGEAVVDTGAVRCVVPPHVADRLGVTSDLHRVATYADGRAERVPITEGMYFTVLDREELEDALILGDEILIGQTLLEKTDLLVDCARQRLIPNPAHPNQPVTKIR